MSVVQDFLRSKELPFSATGWDDLTNKRIISHIDSGKLNEGDFLNLLASVEECGRQHVFLYKCEPAVALRLLGESRVQSQLRSRGLDALLTSPLALDVTEVPTIVDVRLEKANVPISLTVKEVYSHKAYKPSSSKEEGNELIRTWRIITTRAVNVAKLHRDGLLELRLASVSASSYKDQRERFVRQLDELIPLHQFSPINFAPAKNKLSDGKTELSAKIRFADTFLRNENGTTVKVTSGSSNDDLAEDQGARAGEDAFLGHNGGYADGHNFFIRAVDGVLSKEILILMSGEPNEFGVMANCSEADYNYVLRELRNLND